ncbi:MAG: OmpH family outer membrane protein [Dissulfuribacterales bacterium]
MKIKRMGIIGAIVMSVFFVLPAYGADVAKIGVVDFQKVLTESEAGKLVQAEMQTKGREMEKSLRDLGAEIESLTDQMSREAMVMSKEKREEKQRELEIKKYDIQTLQKKYQTKFRKLEADNVAKLQKEIFDIAGKIGKEGGYLLIIEKSAAVYYPDSIDITDTVIEKYNKQSGGPK